VVLGKTTVSRAMGRLHRQRALIPYLNGAIRMLEDGSRREDIDTAVPRPEPSDGAAPADRPDGLDTHCSSRALLFEEFKGRPMRAAASAPDGHRRASGPKVGRGCYDYEG
jgi:3-hydroxyacyl-CoA dehydrogenase